MKISRAGITALILLLICVIIHVYSLDSQRVETGYSNGFFSSFSPVLRSFFNVIPFSIGDILYAGAISWMFWKLLRFMDRRIRKNRIKEPLNRRGRLMKLFIILTSLYIVFNIFWGINYNRKGIASQLMLKTGRYNELELRHMNCILLDKVNSSKLAIVGSQYPTNRELFLKTTNAYNEISKKYHFLEYKNPSLKPALWGFLGNYAGFTGYYNPFSGEAQVNTTVPKFLHPFVACHEVAHQIGYAKEMEANFVGYLAASASKDTLFHYSVYLDLFLYANRNLSRSDSLSAAIYRKELIEPVQADLQEWITFSRKHRNPAEPVVRWMYGKFLEGNQQPEGILSYDEVTAFIIAYYKKFGKI
jgi:hypothetical protein